MKTLSNITEGYISISEAAGILGIKEQSLRGLISRGKKFTVYKFYHMTFLLKEDIEEYKRKRRIKRHR